jgi:hypothetical protein
MLHPNAAYSVNKGSPTNAHSFKWPQPSNTMTTGNNLNIDHHKFLLASGALGATVALPSPVSDTQVNEAWGQL